MILYHIKENMPLTQKEKIFLQICRECGLPVRKLTEKDRHKTVAELLGMKIPGAGKARTAGIKDAGVVRSAGNAAETLPELLIFGGTEDRQLDEFLAAYKQRGLLPVELKAVVTAHNISWTLETLISELKKERASFGQP